VARKSLKTRHYGNQRSFWRIRGIRSPEGRGQFSAAPSFGLGLNVDERWRTSSQPLFHLFPYVSLGWHQRRGLNYSLRRLGRFWYSGSCVVGSPRQTRNYVFLKAQIVDADSRPCNSVISPRTRTRAHAHTRTRAHATRSPTHSLALRGPLPPPPHSLHLSPRPPSLPPSAPSTCIRLSAYLHTHAFILLP
jgi:hypothetical protein